MTYQKLNYLKSLDLRQKTAEVGSALESQNKSVAKFYIIFTLTLTTLLFGCSRHSKNSSTIDEAFEADTAAIDIASSAEDMTVPANQSSDLDLPTVMTQTQQGQENNERPPAEVVDNIPDDHPDTNLGQYTVNIVM